MFSVLVCIVFPCYMSTSFVKKMQHVIIEHENATYNSSKYSTISIGYNYSMSACKMDLSTLTYINEGKSSSKKAIRHWKFSWQNVYRMHKPYLRHTSHEAWMRDSARFSIWSRHSVVVQSSNNSSSVEHVTIWKLFKRKLKYGGS